MKPRVKPRFGSAADAATRSGLSVRTIRRLIERGELAISRVGRRVLVDLAELDRYVKRLAKAATPAASPRVQAAGAPLDVKAYNRVCERAMAGPAPIDPDPWEVPI